MDWISIEDKLPSEVGEYRCKNGDKEFPCFYVRNAKGEKVWMKPSEDLVITHWRLLPNYKH
jgi:hypothetical protein